MQYLAQSCQKWGEGGHAGVKTDLNWKLEKKEWELLSKEEVLSHVELLISDVEMAVFFIFKITIQLNHFENSDPETTAFNSLYTDD